MRNIEALIIEGFDAYQERAAQTAIYPKESALSYLALGLAGEAGEVSNKIKKLIRGDTISEEEFREFLIGETGDVLWYLALLCEENGISLGDVAVSNNRKLLDRAARGSLRGSGDNR